MFVGVVFARLFGVMHGLQMMTMRHVRVMPALFVIARFVMIRGCAMMFRGMLVMLSRFAMIFDSRF